MRTALRIGFCCVLLGGVVAALWYRQRNIGRLETEIANLRGQEKEIVVLRAENQRLTAAAPDRAEAMRKKREELLRLQAQIIAGQKQVELMERRRASPPVKSPSSNGPTPTVVLAPGMMLLETMQNVGRATPTQAIQTGFWAQNHGDLQTFVDGLAFDAEGKAKLDTLFVTLPAAEQARFQSAERWATIIGMASSDGASGPIQMVEKSQGPGTAEVGLHLPLPNGQTSEVKTLQLRLHPDGWKVAVPAGEAEMIAGYWSVLPPAQRKALGKD